jgi:hypothetical protein
MLTRRYLHDDNRIHEDNHLFGHSVANEFDFDDPDLMDIELFAQQKPWANSDDIKAVRDFILNCSLYITDLETAIGEARQEFWEAREHAYRIISALLIDLNQYDCEG